MSSLSCSVSVNASHFPQVSHEGPRQYNSIFFLILVMCIDPKMLPRTRGAKSGARVSHTTLRGKRLEKRAGDDRRIFVVLSFFLLAVRGGRGEEDYEREERL